MTDAERILHEIERRMKALGLTAKQLSKEAGLGDTYIRDLAEGRVVNPGVRAIRGLAKRLGCAPSDLTDPSHKLPLKIISEQGGGGDPHDPPTGYVWVPTLDIRPGMGGGAADADDVSGPPALMPEHVIRQELRGDPSDFLMMEVDGQSMAPILESGDRVMIDRRKLNVQQPGIFVVHDGLGWVAKWVEHVQGTDPAAVRIFSENQRFTPYQRTLEEARLIGRVVWFARKM